MNKNTKMNKNNGKQAKSNFSLMAMEIIHQLKNHYSIVII